MDLNFTEEEQAFRTEVRAWLRDTLPRNLSEKVRLGKRLGKADFELWHSLLNYRGREQACACPPAQIPACALTHGAPASDDDERPLVRPRVLKPVAENPRNSDSGPAPKVCPSLPYWQCRVPSAEWSIPPTVGICKPGDTNGGYPCWVSGTRY